MHLRITFDLKTTEGVAKYRRFLDEAADIVLKFGGSFSGEHGDGQARAMLLPKMFGPELMDAFREFKRLWDPTNRMNPGKLVDPVQVYDATENLRIGPGYQAAATGQKYFQFPHDGGSLGAATERCVGVGACRKESGGTMCPSYMATREEKHSTRGRAHLLWELLQGNTLSDGWQNEQVKDALDLCLSCKACKTECPVNVDLSTYKAEFLAHYYERHRHPLAHHAFGRMDRWARMASAAPALANLGAQLPGIKQLLHIAPQRTLPQFAAKTFRAGYKASGTSSKTKSKTSGKPVLLWADTWNNYFHPQALHAAAQLLGASGHAVEVHPGHICCGRPLYDFGFLTEARQYLARILRTFARQIDAGTPFVMLEPSCASVFTEELLNFFPHDARAQKLAAQTQMLSQTLGRAGFEPAPQPGRKILVHGHCHQKALYTMKDEMALLRATGAEVTALDSGCCGMAGPFGFEADKYDVSQTLANRVLLPAVRAARAETLIVTNGFSCREQIAQNSSRRAVHLAEALLGG